MYWEEFYSSRADEVPTQASDFAHWVVDKIPANASVIDLGCGTGRDSVFFAKRGHLVLAVDQVSIIPRLLETERSSDEDLRGRVQFLRSDLGTDILSRNFSLAVRDLRRNQAPVVIYARFLLHSMTENQVSNLLRSCHNVVKTGERVFLEYRTVQGVAEPYVFGEHYRRVIDADDFVLECGESGFAVDIHEESDTFAVLGAERPSVARTVLISSSLPLATREA